MTSKVAKFISRLITKSIWFVSIIFILLVLVLSLVKVSLPYWLKQKESIIGQLESSIGGNFDYQALQVNWSDFHPVVTIKDLTWLSSDGNVWVKATQNRLEVDVWKTLYYGDLATKEVEVQGVELQLGSIQANNSDINLEQTLDLIADEVNNLSHQYISLKDVTIRLKDAADSQQHLSQLIFKQDKNKKQLLVDSSGDYVGSGRLVIETQGSVLSKDGDIHYFLDFADLDVELLASKVGINKLADYKTVNAKFWGLQKDRLLETARLELSNDNSEQAKVNLKLNLALENGLYQINSDEFIISLNQEKQWVTHSSHINVNSVSVNNETEYHLKTGTVPLAFMRTIVAPLMEEQSQFILKGLNPKGIVNYSNFVFNKKDDRLLPMHGEASIKDFAIKAYKDIPGIELTQVELNGHEGIWNLKVTAENSHFDWRPNFKSIIPINSLQLNAQYQIDYPNIINVSLLELSNADSEVKARASLDVTDDFAMAIYAEAEDVVVANLHSYWPRKGSFTPKTLKYLDNSLLGGNVPYAKFIWQGKVDEFPFKNRDGVFDIQAEVQSARFEFEEDWPVATNISGKASFENEKMTITAYKGELLGAKVNKAKAVLPDLKSPNEQLWINIDAQTDVESYKKIYQKSPLLELLGEDLLPINFDGFVKVDLFLDLLLAKEVDLKVDGKAFFDGNIISGIPYDIELTDTKGKVAFTHNGAIVEQLKANYLGNPFVIDIKVDEYTDDDSSLQIDAVGKVNFEKVAGALLGFSPVQVNGVSDITAHYKLYDKNTESESLIVRSDLIGSSIKGPDWIAKDESSKAPLLMTLQSIEDKVQVRASYKDTLAVQLAFDVQDDFAPIGLVKLGGIATQNIQVPEQGLAIEGYFDELVLHEWLDAFSFPSNLSSSSGETTMPHWIERINITTPRLEFAGQTFTKVRINDVKETNSGELYRFNLYSEQARANVSRKNNGQKQLIIEHLNIALNSDSDDASNPVDLALQEYDNWLFECQNCKVNGYHFGPLSLTSQYQNGVININGQGTAGSHLNAQINGVIDDDLTNVSVAFNVDNPDELMKFWQVDGGVRETKTSGQLNLTWPGRLHDFELSKLDGAFKIKAGSGSIKDLSDRKARIFSLFSLQSIPRRLSLDFSDIFSDGFFYDEIIGDFNIENGVLVTKRAEIKGTAADVVVNGFVDLNNQTVDQQVLVTPKLGSSLPVLAGWAIEPTTGLIMLIVSKIFEPALNVVSQIEYKISGALEDPRVVEVSKKSKEVQVTEEQIEAQKQLEAIENAKEQQEPKP